MVLTLNPTYTVRDNETPTQTGIQTSVKFAYSSYVAPSAIPTPEEYRQLFVSAGRSPEEAERLVDGLSNSSLYDSQTS